MNHCRKVAIAILLIHGWTITTSANAQDLTFNASDLLPKAATRGPNYEIANKVTLKNNRFVFLIRTTWGTLPAEGIAMLELRLREMYAIERARKLSNDPQLLASALKTLQKTPDGVRILLTDPRGAIARAPKGVIQTVTNFTNKQNRRAGTESRRKFAAEIGCDPETSNPILKRLLDEMAVRRGLGIVAAKTGLGFALPGLSLLPTTAEIKETVAKKLPHEINTDIANELKQAGVPQAAREKFCFESIYTTTQRLQLLLAYKSIEEIFGADHLIARASNVESESDALAVLQQTQLLAELNAKFPIAVITESGWPIAILKNKTYTVISVDDVTTSNEQLGVRLAAFRKRFPTQQSKLLTTGRLSQSAKVAFERQSISPRF